MNLAEKQVVERRIGTPCEIPPRSLLDDLLFVRPPNITTAKTCSRIKNQKGDRAKAALEFLPLLEKRINVYQVAKTHRNKHKFNARQTELAC